MRQAKVTKRKKPGPPPSGRTPIVGFRLDAGIMSRVDAYAKKHGHETRTAAIRQLIEHALDAACHRVANTSHASK
jgi:metal-responsive CopG/Arc/MetJ family transcriptional regulator